MIAEKNKFVRVLFEWVLVIAFVAVLLGSMLSSVQAQPAANQTGLSITHTVNNGSEMSTYTNDTVFYRIYVHNNGTTTADPFTIERTVPEDMGLWQFSIYKGGATVTTTSVLSANIPAPANGIAPATAKWYVSDLPAGEQVYLYLAVQFQPDLPENAITTSTITVDSPSTPVIGNNPVHTRIIWLNYEPLANDDFYEMVSISASLKMPVTNNDIEIDSAPITLSVIDGPFNGTAAVSGTNIIYTPTPGYIGQDNLTYVFSDGLASDDALVTIDIRECPAGPTVFVDQSATGANTGQDWDNAYTSLRTAIQAADGCTPVTEMWVAAGEYTPGNARGHSFVMRDGLAIYGGFEGTETAVEQRDWEVYKTVLSGDIDDNDLTDAFGVVTTTEHINGNNSYRIVTAVNVTTSAVLDGFIITGGGDNPNSYSSRSGAGLYNNGGSPTLSNLLFIGNSAVGLRGGALNTSNSKNLIVTDVIFRNNHGGDGGGMHNYNGNVTLQNVIFQGNTSDDPDMGGFGGAFGNSGANSEATLSNVLFSGNYNEGGGGAIVNWQGRLTLVNVTITGNHAGWGEWGPEGGGGGIFNYANITLHNTIVWNNKANNNTGTSQSAIANAGVLTAAYSLVEGYKLPGMGNLDGTNPANAPVFVQSVAPSLAPTTAGDYRLQSGSPGRNDGDNALCPSTDIDYQPRPGAGSFECDMGAYERQVVITFTYNLNNISTNVLLNWQRVVEATRYGIYRQDVPYFTPSGDTQAGQTSSLGYVDPGMIGNSAAHYFYTAVPLDHADRALTDEFEYRGIFTYEIALGNAS